MTKLSYSHTRDELDKLNELIQKTKKAPLMGKAQAAECALDCALLVFDQLNRRVAQLESDSAALGNWRAALAHEVARVERRVAALEGAKDG